MDFCPQWHSIRSRVEAMKTLFKVEVLLWVKSWSDKMPIWELKWVSRSYKMTIYLRVEVLLWVKSWSDEMTIWELKCYYESRVEVMKWLFESWSVKSWSDEMTIWELKCYYESRVEVIKWLFESWSVNMSQELKW